MAHIDTIAIAAANVEHRRCTSTYNTLVKQPAIIDSRLCKVLSDCTSMNNPIPAGY